MRYDVFISYSRKDSRVVDKICRTLDANGITYFIDRTGISGGLEFPEIIVNAIENSVVFLFIGSKNSYSSHYVANEVSYAYNVKKHNTIIPYLIDKTPMSGSLLFIFGNVNYRKINEHPIDTVLVNDIKNILGKETETLTQELRSVQEGVSVKSKHPLLYALVGVQTFILFVVLKFFSQLFELGFIHAKPHHLGWWSNLILCIFLSLSIVSTLMMIGKRKLVFYSLCLLDIIQSVCVMEISHLIYGKQTSYSTNTYTLLNNLGESFSNHPILGFICIVFAIGVHVFIMYSVLKMKHKGVSAWDTMK